MKNLTKNEIEVLFNVSLTDPQYELMSRSADFQNLAIDALTKIEESAIKSPEEKQAAIDRMFTEMGQGMRQNWGTFETRQQPLSVVPFETKTAYGKFEPLVASLFPQQTIGMSRAKVEKPATFSTKAVLYGNLEKHYQSLPEADRKANVEAGLLLYSDIKKQNPHFSDEQVYEEVIATINSLLDVSVIPQEVVDPRMKSKVTPDASTAELLSDAYQYQKTGGEALPNFSKKQYELLKNQQNLKYRPEINKQLMSIQSPGNVAQSFPKSELFQLSEGDYLYVPTEVLTYLKDHPTGGVVYSPEIDTRLLELIKSGDYKDGGTVDLNNNKSAREALAAVRAYKKLGDPDWRTDLQKRQQVLSHLDTYTIEGILNDKVPTGGLTETTTGWLLRSAMSPFNVVAAVGTEAIEAAGGAAAGVVAEGLEAAGVIPELEEGTSYFDPLAKSRLREIERPQAYSGYGIVGAIADNIARNKGFVGEGLALSNQLNMEGLAKYATVGGYFVFDILDPSIDIASGTAKGYKAWSQSQQLHKAMYGAKNVKEAKKAFSNAFLSEIDNSLLLGATRVVGKRFGVDIPDLGRGDVLLSMGDNVGRTLHYNHLKKHGDDLDDFFDNATVLEIENRGNPNDFYNVIRANDKAKRLLEEYEDTYEALNTLLIQESTQVTPVALKRSYPKLNQKVLNKVKDLGDGDAQKALSKIYGRNLMFEVAPDIKMLDNVQWVTPKTLVHKNFVDDVLAVAVKSDMGEALGKVLKYNPNPEDLTIAVRPSRSPGFNVFDQNVFRTPQQTLPAFNLHRLSGEEITALKRVLDDVDLPFTYKNQVKKNIDDKILFQDDYNRIHHAIIDKVAELEPQTLTIENVNQLNVEQRSRLLEAEGTVYRSTIGASDFTKRLARTNFGRRITKYFAEKGWIQQESLENYLNTPIVRSEANMPTQQQRFMQQMNAERGTLNVRTEQLYRDMMKNKGNILSRYDYTLTDVSEIDSVSALGLMIVGEKTDLNGVIQQQVNLEETIKWMINNIFVLKNEKVPARYSLEDHLSGASNAYKSGIFNSHGKMYIQQQARQVAKLSQSNPQAYWSYMSDLIDDINMAIQNPNSRNRTVFLTDSKGVERKISGPIVNPNKNMRTVPSVDMDNMENFHATVMLSSYLIAENNRISAKALNDVLQFELPEAAVSNILPNMNVTQNMFQNSVREAIKILYFPTTDSDTYLKLSELVQLQKQLEIVNKTHPNVNVQKLDQSILREVKAEAKLYDSTIQNELRTAKRYYRENTRRQIKERRDFLREEYKKRKQTLVEETENIYRRKSMKIEEEQAGEISTLTKEEKTNKDLLRLRNIRDSQIKATKKRLKSGDDLDESIRKIRAKFRLEEQKLKDKLGDGYTKSQKLKDIEKKYQERLSDLEADLRKTLKETNEEVQKAYVEKGNKELEELKQALYEKQEKELDEILSASLDENQLKMLEIQLSMLRSPQEKIEYMKRMTDTYDPVFDDILEALEKQALGPDELDTIVQAVKSHAEVVMRNNNISYSLSKGSVDDLEEMLDTIFRGDGGMARAMFGEEDYLYMKNKLINNPRQKVRKNIIQAMRGENGRLLPFINKALDFMNQSFYTAILGYSPASHGRNILSGPNIIYQTTGVMFTPELATKGWKVVRDGSNIGSKGYLDIAVKTPDGRVYTYGDIYEGIQKVGVRNQFSYIQSKGGKENMFLKEIQGRYEGNPPSGLVNTVRKASELALAAQTKEDFVFRSAAAIKALQEGRSFNEAMQVARRSMFDYSDVPESVQRYMNAIFVFSSFTVQSAKEIFYALQDVNKLKRVAKALELRKNANTFYESFNDEQPLPYDMYYPIYAQGRLTYPVGTYQDKETFLMGYNSPAIESLNQLTGIAASMFPPVKATDIDPFLPAIQLLNPLIKEVVLPKSMDKYTPTNTMPELLFYLELAGYNTPSEIATKLEEMCGGKVTPVAAKKGSKGSRNGYRYPLSEEQQFRLYHRSLYMVFNNLGYVPRLRSIARLVSPEGSTYGGDTNPLLILGTITGAYTFSQVDTADKQQLEALKRREAYLRAIINGEEGMSDAAIYRDQELLYQPSEEE